MEKYFDYLLIDEIQDFSGNDFNLLIELVAAKIQVLFVGDFFQHTFDTSRDGNTRKNLHKNGLPAYIKEFEKAGLSIDTTTLKKTHRCGKQVCDFISSQIGINIESNKSDGTEVFIIENKEQAHQLYEDNEKVKLFYQDYQKFNCWSNNWGRCKGLNHYTDVCVVLNKNSAKLFQAGKLKNLPDSTRNKLYVACSRANGNLNILLEEHVAEFKSKT